MKSSVFNFAPGLMLLAVPPFHSTAKLCSGSFWYCGLLHNPSAVASKQVDEWRNSDRLKLQKSEAFCWSKKCTGFLSCGRCQSQQLLDDFVAACPVVICRFKWNTIKMEHSWITGHLKKFQRRFLEIKCFKKYVSYRGIGPKDTVSLRDWTKKTCGQRRLRIVCLKCASLLLGVSSHRCLYCAVMFKVLAYQGRSFALIFFA